ncbi:MAG: enoyl-CoA hydratase/isomerase family protein [Actinomycetota bacterium]
MSDKSFVDVRTEGRACVITLKREEKLNALSTEVERQIAAALEGEEVRKTSVVVLTGSGKAFSAGADINEFLEATPGAILDYYKETGEVYETVARLPQPVIAAISGWCLGGGFELAMAADLRIADDSAEFGLPETGIGIIPSSGGTQRLVRLAGPARAKELILLGKRFGAREALDWGLVNEVVERGAALTRALDLAKELAEMPPLALQVAKQAVDAMSDSSREAGVLIERLAYGTLAQTEDAQEAAVAFTEKRDPKFKGR